MNDNSSHYRSPDEKRRGPRIVLAGLAAVAGLAAGCTDATAEAGLRIVATTTILGDVAGNVVGEAGTVGVLLPRNADPHDYQASAREVADLMRADLVIANGLDLEEGLHDVLETAASDGVEILWIGDHLDPIPFGAAAGSDHGGLDPHVWLDPVRMADAAVVIAAELEALDPGAGWMMRAEVYAAELLAADVRIAATLERVPAASRKLITGHDSLEYFAARYGFEVIGTVVPGGSTLAEPSSSELAGLIEIIEREEVPAIFSEAFESAALADALAAELGSGVTVVPLYTGSLGEPGSGAETLIGLLTTNAVLIAEALS